MKNKTLKILVLILVQGINTFLSFIFLPYLSRALSVEDYGTYGQTLLIVNIVFVGFSFGLGKIIYTYFSDPKQDNNEVFISNLYVAVLSGIFAILIFLPLVGFTSNLFDNQNIEPLLLIYILSVPFSIAYLTVNASLIFFDKVSLVAKIAVFTNILKILLIIIAIQILNSILAIFYFLLFISFLQFSIGIYFSKKIFSFSSKKFKLNLALEQLKYGLPLGLTSILGVMFKSTDSFMISSTMSVSDYAIYRNGAFEIPFLATLYSSISAIVLPSISNLFYNEDYNKILFLKKRVINNSFAIIFPILIFFIFYSEDIIITYLSSTYKDSSSIFAVYSLILLFRINDYEDIFVVSKNANKMLYIYLIAFILNLILNYFFIINFGSVGAALATLISIFFIALSSMILSSKIINKNVLDFFDFNLLLKTSFIYVTSFFILAIVFSFFEEINIVYKLFSYLFITGIIIIRFSLVEIGILNQVFTKMPYFGTKLNNIINFIKK